MIAFMALIFVPDYGGLKKYIQEDMLLSMRSEEEENGEKFLGPVPQQERVQDSDGTDSYHHVRSPHYLDVRFKSVPTASRVFDAKASATAV